MPDFGRTPRYFSVEEYLSLEERATERSEYFQGSIFSMSGGTLNHNRILNNVARKLGEKLEGGDCEVFTSDVRLRVEAHDLFTYPDLMVVCGKPQMYMNRSDTLTDATVLLEVLSPSTKQYDRGPKADFYRSLPSLDQLLLVDQEKRAVTSWEREGDTWVLRDLAVKDGELEFKPWNFHIPLDEIYRGVEPSSV